MPESAPDGRLPGEEKGIQRQIRQEIERAYRPRESYQRIEPMELSQPVSGDLAELRSAVAALFSSYARVGQTPPEPPTLRGRIGAQLVKLVQRLLFWYTPQIVHFQYSALKAFEAANRALEAEAEKVQRLETELQRERQARETLASAALSRAKTLERRMQAFRLEVIPRVDQEIARMDAQQAAHEDRIGREVTRLKAQQTVQENLIARLGSGNGQPPRPAEPHEDAHQIDSFYAQLEDEFRGSRQEIKERLKVYLNRITEAGLGGETMPVLDLGCGRGEWLELLRERQLHASGVDLNRVELAICREHGLPVTEADAIEHLRSLPEASLGVLTAFHVIEHLPLPRLLDLLDAARRALKPGGLLIFETPNPNNLFVSSRYFYIDPTHLHPIPIELGRFLPESRGFERIEIVELHPWPLEHHIDTRTGGEMAARFNECFYGPQDYAIIGWKP